jgi:hypothetical protein
LLLKTKNNFYSGSDLNKYQGLAFSVADGILISVYRRFRMTIAFSEVGRTLLMGTN